VTAEERLSYRLVGIGAVMAAVAVTRGQWAEARSWNYFVVFLSPFTRGIL